MLPGDALIWPLICRLSGTRACRRLFFVCLSKADKFKSNRRDAHRGRSMTPMSPQGGAA